MRGCGGLDPASHGLDSITSLSFPPLHTVPSSRKRLGPPVPAAAAAASPHVPDVCHSTIPPSYPTNTPRVDRSLDELENNPLPLQKEIYQFSRSPVGTATSSALTAAAKASGG